MSFIESILEDEALRREQFPIARDSIFFAHASVTVLPKAATDAIRDFAAHSETAQQESAWSVARVEETRQLAAELIGATPDEIALLGPTSLGLNLVANGLTWEPGDEIVGYFEDYPANVYPWRALASKGVKYIGLEPELPGVLTWDVIEPALTDRTKLVALASCHFQTGYRIDIDGIGRRLHERGIFFCLDGIQTVGAFPTPVEHVDFMAADSHKWMLGPAGAGIFYVKKSRQQDLNPALLGSINVSSPNFIAQPDIRYVAGAKRYEPGILNLVGIHGMWGAMKMLLKAGPEAISARLLDIRRTILDTLRPLGYQLVLEEHDLSSDASDANRSAIITLTHPGKDIEALFDRLKDQSVVTSLRRNRAGEPFIRLSPHFYNTGAEIDRVAELLR